MQQYQMTHHCQHRLSIFQYRQHPLLIAANKAINQWRATIQQDLNKQEIMCISQHQTLHQLHKLQQYQIIQSYPPDLQNATNMSINDHTTRIIKFECYTGKIMRPALHQIHYLQQWPIIPTLSTSLIKCTKQVIILMLVLLGIRMLCKHHD